MASEFLPGGVWQIKSIEHIALTCGCDEYEQEDCECILEPEDLTFMDALDRTHTAYLSFPLPEGYELCLEPTVMSMLATLEQKFPGVRKRTFCIAMYKDKSLVGTKVRIEVDLDNMPKSVYIPPVDNSGL